MAAVHATARSNGQGSKGEAVASIVHDMGLFVVGARAREKPSLLFLHRWYQAVSLQLRQKHRRQLTPHCKTHKGNDCEPSGLPPVMSARHGAAGHVVGCCRVRSRRWREIQQGANSRVQ